MGKAIREWFPIGISLFALAVSAASFRTARQSTTQSTSEQAKDFFDRGWDQLAGKPGTRVIHGFSTDRSAVELGCREIRRGLELLPSDPRGLRHLGACQRALGEFGAAAETYRKAIAAEPGSAQAHAGLGAALMEQGKLDQAVTELKEATRLSPRYALASELLGEAYFRQEKLEEAARALQPALQQNDAFAFSRYGKVLLAQGHTADALKALRTAADLEPENAEHHATLGMALYYVDQLDDAEQALRRAIRLDTTDAAVHRHLAAALRRQGKAKEADEEDARAVELGKGRFP